MKNKNFKKSMNVQRNEYFATKIRNTLILFGVGIPGIIVFLYVLEVLVK